MKKINKKELFWGLIAIVAIIMLIMFYVDPPQIEHIVKPSKNTKEFMEWLKAKGA